jgi:hypothetical protein
MYISIYIFKAIIFGDIEVKDFENFKVLKVKGALMPMCTKSLLLLGEENFRKNSNLRKDG